MRYIGAEFHITPAGIAGSAQKIRTVFADRNAFGKKIVSGQILRFEHSQETIHFRCKIHRFRLCCDQAFTADLMFGIFIIIPCFISFIF